MSDAALGPRPRSSSMRTLREEPRPCTERADGIRDGKYAEPDFSSGVAANAG
jgi:hypothetical protein